jgi:hypothetical protein
MSGNDLKTRLVPGGDHAAVGSVFHGFAGLRIVIIGYLSKRAARPPVSMDDKSYNDV